MNDHGWPFSNFKLYFIGALEYRARIIVCVHKYIFAPLLCDCGLWAWNRKWAPLKEEETLCGNMLENANKLIKLNVLIEHVSRSKTFSVRECIGARTSASSSRMPICSVYEYSCIFHFRWQWNGKWGETLLFYLLWFQSNLYNMKKNMHGFLSSYLFFSFFFSKCIWVHAKQMKKKANNSRSFTDLITFLIKFNVVRFCELFLEQIAMSRWRW